jgi:hypothetical protein
MSLRAASIHALKILCGTAALLAVLALLMILFGPVADRSTPRDKDRAASVNATRQILLAATAGVAALVGLGFTARTFYLSRRGQITDRYIKAISLLASEKVAERLGGIYALEHLMRESSKDHETVVDVLAAFIRETAPIQPASKDAVPLDVNRPHRLPADLQAALTALGRRPRRPEANRIDLMDTDLRGVNLRGARLDGVMLHGARLENANFVRAKLRGAQMPQANLQQACLDRANLQFASFFDAELQGVILQHCKLKRVHFNGAQLQGAYLYGSNFSGAYLLGAQFCNEDGSKPAASLTVEQLESAHLDEGTRIPNDLRKALEVRQSATKREPVS